MRILFLCIGNAARSQMGEALLRHLSGERALAFSAGSRPAAEVHPQAKAVLQQKFGIDTSRLRPKPLSEFADQRFDFVITVCDEEGELCPVFPGAPQQLHWSYPDPALEPDPESQRRACERVATQLAARLRTWMASPDIQRRLDQS
jgi:ArsR family transcriptional regulator, arsenate/arsenite/antimonite-responsive transcriptional repressor / arsenate reductase (thioredoxin)